MGSYKTGPLRFQNGPRISIKLVMWWFRVPHDLAGSSCIVAVRMKRATLRVKKKTTNWQVMLTSSIQPFGKTEQFNPNYLLQHGE